MSQKYKVYGKEIEGVILVEADDLKIKDEGLVFYRKGKIIAIHPKGSSVELIY